MRENFKIVSGNLYRDQAAESLQLYYDRQMICYIFILIGVVLLLYILIN